VDPRGPRAPLAFVFSPLVGTPLTTSAKFAIACKLSGNDAIVIIGRAAEPPVLLVEGDGARLFPAPEAGLPAADADPDRVRPERPDGRRRPRRSATSGTSSD